ncbi:MAG TPA: RNA polymerase sigma factor [Pirellulaceae bacterium]|nr:RNA polymerase sigma factor [Pirellulaceae bacterium]
MSTIQNIASLMADSGAYPLSPAREPRISMPAAELDGADIASAVNGDAAAYARRVTRYQQEIAQWMWRFTHDRRELDELVHDVFVEAYFSLRTYRQAGPLLHWLRKIATRVGYRFWKQAGRRRQVKELSTEEWQELRATETAAAPDRETNELLHRALAELPPRDRLVLTFMYLDELPTERIAELTGWSRVMVKVQAFRARAKLKKLLAKYEF